MKTEKTDDLEDSGLTLAMFTVPGLRDELNVHP